MRGNLSRDQRMINERNLACIGKDQGRLVFAAKAYGGPMSSTKPADQIRRMPDPRIGKSQTDQRSVAGGMLLPDGTPYKIPVNAWPDGLRAGIRASAWPDRWPSDAVWAVLFDDARKQEWLCVGAGLAVLQRGETTLRHFGNTEGVCCGPVLDGVELGGKLLFRLRLGRCAGRSNGV